MKLRKLLSITLVAAMVLGLTACGGKGSSTESPEKTGSESVNTDTGNAETGSMDSASTDAANTKEITYKVCTYYGGDSTVFAEFAAEKIKEKYPNVTLEFETLPSDGGLTIKTRAATGDLPDILLVDSGSIDVLAKSGSIITLDEYVDKLNIKDYYTPAIMENCLYSPDGHVYQFPMGSISPILWYYNKQIFADNNVKVPTNFDELMTAVTAFKEKGIIPMAMFGKEPWPLGAFFDTFAVKENPGGNYALSKGEAKASDESYSKIIGKMEQAIKAGIFQDGATNTDFDTASALFKEGKSAMFLNGSWYTADAITGLGDKADVILSYPTADAGKETVNQYSMTGGGDTSGMAVTANAEDKELAANIAFLFAYYREVAQYEKNSLVTTPLQTDGLTLENELDPISAKLLETIPQFSYNTKFLHTLPNTKFATTFTEEMQKLLVGETKDDFIKNVDKSIEDTVQK
ncbi:extracellular solute-binding protein [Anaerocolumna sedimenticola]|uniref:Extracellular solute-binding protein n=1 Tax=Anaerocolumna sedimenticola TaxID=2696063 RepID=A0A6P1TJD2_9FIRM|nr:extracellular solute-binding protein [Anaerocolumna sedimenticola]QHQ60229.1 extracellular solute-binding protein [Anaerocolumna sedimenticola]